MDQLAGKRPTEVRFSPDGDRLYVADTDGYLRVYDTRTHELLNAWKIGESLGGMDISPDGSFLVIVDRQLPTTYKVDPHTGEATDYPFASGAGKLLFDVAVLSDGTALFSGIGVTSSRILDFDTGTYTEEPQVGQISVLSRSASGGDVLISESGGPFQIYHTGTGIVARTFAGGSNWGIQAFSGSLAAQYIPNEGIHIYDGSLNRKIMLTAWNHGAITDLAFSKDSAWLYVLENGGTIVKISTVDWSIAAEIPVGASVGSWSGHTGSTNGSRLILDPDEQVFSVATDDGLLLVDNPPNPAPPPPVTPPPVPGDPNDPVLSDSRPSEVRFSPDGDRLYVADTDGYLRVYDTHTHTLLDAWKIGQKLGGMDISPDGSFLVVIERNLSTIYKVDALTGAKTSYPYAPEPGLGLLFDVAVLSDGTALFSQDFHGSGWTGSRMLDFATGTYTTGPPINQSSVLTRSPSGADVVIGEPNSSDGPFDIYYTGTGIVARTSAAGYNFGVQAFSGALAAQYVPNEGIHVYDAALHRKITLTAWNQGAVTDLAFSKDNAWLYVLDNVHDTIVKISTADWSIAATIPVGSDVGGWMGRIGATNGSRLILDPDEQVFSIATDTRLILLDNPYAPPEPTGPGGGGSGIGLPIDLTLPGLLLPGLNPPSPVPPPAVPPPANPPPPPGDPNDPVLSEDRPSEIRFSPDGARLYAADSDGYLRVYDTRTHKLLNEWKIGQKLGGMDISPDGSFLVVIDRHVSTTYKVNALTGAKTSYPYATEGHNGLLFDVAVLSDGTALFSQDFNGSGWTKLRVLNFATGQYAYGPQITQSAVLTRSASGADVLIGEPNSSNGPIDIYHTGTGIVATTTASGYNWGIQAYWGSLVAQYNYSEGIHIYDGSLQRKITLTGWNYGAVTDLAFSKDGAWLYVLDNEHDAIVKISTADWSVAATIPVGSDVGSWMGMVGASNGSRLILDPHEQVFGVVTDSRLILVDNPFAPPETPGSGGTGGGLPPPGNPPGANPFPGLTLPGLLFPDFPADPPGPVPSPPATPPANPPSPAPVPPATPPSNPPSGNPVPPATPPGNPSPLPADVFGIVILDGIVLGVPQSYASGPLGDWALMNMVI